jgi:type II secretory pathway component PulM
MFYKALGWAVWKLGVAYLRRRIGRREKALLAAGVVSLLALAYLAARSSST